MNKRSTVLAGVFVAVAAAVALAAAGRDGAVIQNSGSTNAPGYTLKVWSDGAVWAVQSNRAGEQTGDPATGRIPADLARRFFTEIRAAKRSGTPTASCMKSASFGTTTVVHYHGWTSPDYECPGNDELTADIHAIAQAARAAGMQAHPVIRHPLLPNEVRRPEPTPAQPSASPEFLRPAP